MFNATHSDPLYINTTIDEIKTSCQSYNTLVPDTKDMDIFLNVKSVEMVNLNYKSFFPI